MPTDAEEHHTFCTPAIATGVSALKAYASRFLEPARVKSLEYLASAARADEARNCEMYVPPSNSKITVKSAMDRIVAG